MPLSCCPLLIAIALNGIWEEFTRDKKRIPPHQWLMICSIPTLKSMRDYCSEHEVLAH
jgi:hypothetical protein